MSKNKVQVHFLSKRVLDGQCIGQTLINGLQNEFLFLHNKKVYLVILMKFLFWQTNSGLKLSIFQLYFNTKLKIHLFQFRNFLFKMSSV